MCGAQGLISKFFCAICRSRGTITPSAPRNARYQGPHARYQGQTHAMQQCTRVVLHSRTHATAHVSVVALHATAHVSIVARGWEIGPRPSRDRARQWSRDPP
eukprot:1033773-Rhodomonas_salina.1